MVGFMGKFMLLTGALKLGHLTLVILAAFNTAIAIYYYLSVVKAAYTEDDEDRENVEVNGLIKATGVVLVMLIVLMGSLPSKFVAIADTAVKTIM